MIQINDEEILVFSDIHVGIKSNSVSRLDVADEYVDRLIEHIKQRNIKTVLFGGDWHHERPAIAVETMCRSIDAIKKITEHARLIFIIGNHDLVTNTDNNFSSMKWLSDMENVELIEKPTECMIKHNKVLLCPWLSELESFQKEEYDGMFGHFDISHKYLIEAYMEDHISEEVSTAEISNIMIKSGFDLDLSEDSKEDRTRTITKANSKKHIGEFIELCKKGGQIYSGHIHQRRTFNIKDRNFTFLGTPFQLTWGDFNKFSKTSDRGHYIINCNTLKPEFFENNDSPMHRKYFISDLPVDSLPIEDIFKKKHIENNFVRLILNKQFDYSKLNEIISHINQQKPKEPCVVDYDFSIEFEEEGKAPDSDHKESKLDYINQYINSLDDKVFKDFDVEKETILVKVREYFDITQEQMI